MVLTTGDAEGAPVRENATGLSRRASTNDADLRATRHRAAGIARLTHLARASLGLAMFAMFAAACIITDVPTFEDEVLSAPKLLPQSTSPDNRQLLFITDTATSQVFEAVVESENDLERDIEVVLYFDYGVPHPTDGSRLYYTEDFDNNAPVPAATEPEPGEEPVVRKASARWFKPQGVSGCHTFTLMVSHAFDTATGCPEDLADSSEITWVAYICDTPDCQTTPVDLSSCPQPTIRCPQVPDDVPKVAETSSSGGP